MDYGKRKSSFKLYPLKNNRKNLTKVNYKEIIINAISISKSIFDIVKHFENIDNCITKIKNALKSNKN